MLIAITLKDAEGRWDSLCEFKRTKFEYDNRLMATNQGFGTAQHGRLMTFYVNLDELNVAFHFFDAIKPAQSYPLRRPFGRQRYLVGPAV